MNADAILGPDDIIPGKPFTDPERTADEAETMRELLRRERNRALAWAEEDGGHQRNVVLREHDARGHRHLLVVPDTRALLEKSDLTAIGFFGSPRQDVDHSVLFELEELLVADMPAYAEAGLLSYYDVELVKGAFGNLILFSTPDVPDEWRASAVHHRAIELAPNHYHGIRLHKGVLGGRLMDGGTITIKRTLYLDYEQDVPWRAVRHFTEPPV